MKVDKAHSFRATVPSKFRATVFSKQGQRFELSNVFSIEQQTLVTAVRESAELYHYREEALRLTKVDRSMSDNEELTKSVAALGTQLTKLQTTVDERFKAVDQRFDAVNTRISDFKDAVDKRFIQTWVAGGSAIATLFGAIALLYKEMLQLTH